MSEIKLKVCGLRDNAKEVLEQIRPDFAGFIYYKKSPRYIQSLPVESLPADVKRVGVFVNERYEYIVERIMADGLSLVQLHGEESVELCLRLRNYAEVIKVFSGNKPLNITLLKTYEPVIDYFMFDTRGDEQYGGSGVSFDWRKLEGLPITKPIILSGGIGLDEVEKIRQLKGVTIYAIDVNSKVESAPGVKKIDLLKKLKQMLP